MNKMSIGPIFPIKSYKSLYLRNVKQVEGALSAANQFCGTRGETDNPFLEWKSRV